MTPQELKNSILQLTIQGKLVEQRPEEGTAEELYQKIQEEKQRLIKAGKIKKEKALPEITEEEKPFEIPDTWKWVRIGSILHKLVDGTHKTPKYTTFGVPFVSVRNISNGILNLGDTKFISEEEHKQLVQRCNPEKGDILLSKVGTTGVPAKVNTNAVFSLFVSVALLKFNTALIDIDFLIYAILTPDFQKQCKEHTRGVGNKNWVIADIANTVFPLPPLAEQKRIVAKIEELLPYIDRYEQAWNRLEDFNKRFPDDMKKSMLQMAIQGKLVEQRPEEGTAEELYQQIQAEKQQLIRAGKIKQEKPLPKIAENEVPFDIPENWKWVRFFDLCAVLTCGYASTPTYVSKENGMPFISAKNVKPYRFMPDDHNYISYELYKKLTQSAKPEKGDILLTRVGAGIGEAAIIDTDLDFAIYVSLTLIKLINNTIIDNRYILYWLNSPIGVISAKKNIYGKNASQGNLNVKNVKKFLVPLPPLAEQKRIVAKLEELLPLCEMLKRG